jgi:hypothetical protein
MFRRTLGTAVVLIGLLVSPSVYAAADCEGTECRATERVKPLDIMQFMREQAASTRVVKPRQRNIRTTIKAQRPAPRATVARRKPAPLPAQAASSFASGPEHTEQANVEVFTGDQHNALDRTADAVPIETVGASIATGPNVQLVDAEEFNDIDRKADDRPMLLATADSVTKLHGERANASGQANVSWLQWIWSALGSTFAALATAVQQLIRW